MVQLATRGTIYDAPAARPYVFRVGSDDLNDQLGGGFQAVHAWVNNLSNQNLYLPDCPDVIPPGATRVVALSATDVARASWTIPPTFAVTQPGGPTGAAIIVFFTAGIEISPTPGVANNPIVSISSGSVAISGPVTIGPGSNTIGAISAVNSSVTVAGTVSISGTPSVSISGTPTVNIGNTPSVSVASGTINIGNTPSVTISGTPTVILGAGVASIGSISAISSTVTVAGTINIGNTPAVTISGTPNVNIASGTVNIGGTPNINIQSQSVNLNTQQPQVAFASLTFPAGVTSTQTTAVVPAGTHALALSGDPTSGLSNVTIKGHTTGTQYFPKDTNVVPAGGLKIFHNQFVIVPVNSVADTSYDVTGTNITGAAIVIRVAAALDAQAVEVTNSGADPIFIADPTFEGWPPIATRAKYDAQGISAPATGSQATVTLAADPIRFYTLLMVSASVVSTTAVVSGHREVKVVTGVTTLFQTGLSTPATAGAMARCDLSDLGQNNAQQTNQALTLSIDTGVANIAQRVAVGAQMSST